MKELKYQAWHIPEKKMYDSVLSLHWLYGEDLHEIQVDTENGPMIINDFILREYTGLKDKTGREIYEGDIVESIYESTHLKDSYRKQIMSVEHDGVNPCFVLVDVTNPDKREYDFIQCGLRRNEVIGNIYENPELLTK